MVKCVLLIAKHAKNCNYSKMIITGMHLLWMHPLQVHRIKYIISIIIATCFPSNPLQLWQSYREYMTEDILNRMRRIEGNQELAITLEMFNEALVIIEDMCLVIANKHCHNWVYQHQIDQCMTHSIKTCNANDNTI